MENKPQRKAKRKLTDIDFSSEGAHIALVSEEQGHGANGHHYALVMKAANYSPEFLEKASQVKVTLEITEFLTRMFSMYWQDAEILARALGYTTKEMDYEKEREEESGENYYQDYITSKVQSIEVMKQLHNSKNISDIVSGLSEDQYLTLLQDQALIEKAMTSIDVEKNKPVTKTKVKTKVVQDNQTDSVEKSAEDVTSIASEVISEGIPSVVTKKHKEPKDMTKEVQVIEQEVEVIAKAQFDEITKKFETQATELQKALDLVKQFETEKKEAVAKSRMEQLVLVCGDKSEVIFKACGESEDQVFADVVKALAEIKEQVEKSAMFEEQGASVEAEQVEESGVAKLIKAKYNK